jgi:hypothetical protein
MAESIPVSWFAHSKATNRHASLAEEQAWLIENGAPETHYGIFSGWAVPYNSGAIITARVSEAMAKWLAENTRTTDSSKYL